MADTDSDRDTDTERREPAVRMWMTDPRRMCRRHLLGEHVECHMILGSLRKGISLGGYVAKGLVETAHLAERHDELAREMLRRGWRHESPLRLPRRTPALGRVDRAASRRELARRCGECRRLLRPRGSRPPNR